MHAAGTRQIVTGLSIAKHQKYDEEKPGDKIFITSMCMGTGMGMAAVFVGEQ
jgi:acetyl-CoA acyltransferase 1